MPTFEDLSGKKIGFLTVLYRAPDWIQPSGQHKRMWHCICECGKECDVRASDIKSGNTTSCGCKSSRYISKNFEDLTGNVYGDFVVLRRVEDKMTPSGQKIRRWECSCKNCGEKKVIYATQIKKMVGLCKCNPLVNVPRKSKRLDSVSIVNSWHPTRNNGVLPENITSLKEVIWWREECGHEWKSTVAKKMKSSECPICKRHSGRTVIGQNDLLTMNPKLAEEWHPTKNGQLTPDSITANNGKKVWWLGKCGHEWEAAVYSRNSGHGCPFCAGNRLEKGVNDLLTVNPKLAEEWHPTKNGQLTPDSITANNRKKVWWLGKCGHEWEAAIGSRNQGRGCPICVNLVFLPGENDFETWCKRNKSDLLDEWDYKKNTVLPSLVPENERRNRRWWLCKLGHSFDMSISLRIGKSKCGCPYCSTPAKKILIGFNDLETTHPNILEEWDYEKNDISPKEISSGSARKIWWKCPVGHSYSQSLVYKVNAKLDSTCPYCSHQKLLKGFNDLETTHPYILQEWDYEKNTVLPSEIGVGTHLKIWWKCPFGHSYQTEPSYRCGKQHTGCTICDKENHTSFPEQALFFYIKKFFPNAINSDRSKIGMELDVMIPELGIAIEYDGKKWHSNDSTEKKKNKACLDNNIRLIRIREEGLPVYDDCICIVRDNVRENDSLSKVIKDVLMLIRNIDEDVDVDKDAGLIYSSYIKTRKEKNLEVKYPEIAKEWHPIRNGDLLPEMIAPGSNKKVWWLGACGHEYQMVVSVKTQKKCGCPYCAGKRVLEGFNDLVTWCNDNEMTSLIDEWDFSKNEILPTQVTRSSDKKVYWKCKDCSNSWECKVDHRTRLKSKCPVCFPTFNKSRRVINIDTQEIFSTIHEAAERYNIDSSAISKVCRGTMKATGGFRWKYYE